MAQADRAAIGSDVPLDRRRARKSKGLDARGHKVPEYGLMPPGVTADWERYGYRFFNDIQYCHGLEAIAQELAAIGHANALPC